LNLSQLLIELSASLARAAFDAIDSIYLVLLFLLVHMSCCLRMCMGFRLQLSHILVRESCRSMVGCQRYAEGAIGHMIKIIKFDTCDKRIASTIKYSVDALVIATGSGVDTQTLEHHITSLLPFGRLVIYNNLFSYCLDANIVTKLIPVVIRIVCHDRLQCLSAQHIRMLTLKFSDYYSHIQISMLLKACIDYHHSTDDVEIQYCLEQFLTTIQNTIKSDRAWTSYVCDVIVMVDPNLTKKMITLLKFITPDASTKFDCDCKSLKHACCILLDRIRGVHDFLYVDEIVNILWALVLSSRFKPDIDVIARNMLSLHENGVNVIGFVDGTLRAISL